jgi:hypothetical protein
MKCPTCNMAMQSTATCCSRCGWVETAATSGWDFSDPHIIALREHHRVHRNRIECAQCGEKVRGDYAIVTHWQEDHPELYRKFMASIGDPRGEAS